MVVCRCTTETYLNRVTTAHWWSPASSQELEIGHARKISFQNLIPKPIETEIHSSSKSKQIETFLIEWNCSILKYQNWRQSFLYRKKHEPRWVLYTSVHVFLRLYDGMIRHTPPISKPDKDENGNANTKPNADNLWYTQKYDCSFCLRGKYRYIVERDFPKNSSTVLRG